MNPNLTRRELELAQLLAIGYRNKDVAQEWSVSLRTVESHKSNLCAKLGTHSIREISDYMRNRYLKKPPPPVAIITVPSGWWVTTTA